MAGNRPRRRATRKISAAASRLLAGMIARLKMASAQAAGIRGRWKVTTTPSVVMTTLAAIAVETTPGETSHNEPSLLILLAVRLLSVLISLTATFFVC